MRLFTYRLGRQHQAVVDRVDLIMDEAARLISQREPRGIGRVEIAVTVSDGIPDLVCAAHERLLGASDWDTCSSGGRHGETTQVSGLGFSIRGAGGGFRADTR